MKSPSKSCELDPVPTSLIKQNIDVFAKYITIIVNRSLSSGCFPDSQKVAHVKPLLEKPNLDKDVFKNYRPVANLKYMYLEKTIERVVSSRISDHVRANNLSDTFQSAKAGNYHYHIPSNRWSWQFCHLYIQYHSYTRR